MKHYSNACCNYTAVASEGWSALIESWMLSSVINGRDQTEHIETWDHVGSTVQEEIQECVFISLCLFFFYLQSRLMRAWCILVYPAPPPSSTCHQTWREVLQSGFKTWMVMFICICMLKRAAAYLSQWRAFKNHPCAREHSCIYMCSLPSLGKACVSVWACACSTFPPWCTQER